MFFFYFLIFYFTLSLHFFPWSAVCSLHFTLSLHFTAGLQSAVCFLHRPFRIPLPDFGLYVSGTLYVLSLNYLTKQVQFPSVNIIQLFEVMAATWAKTTYLTWDNLQQTHHQLSFQNWRCNLAMPQDLAWRSHEFEFLPLKKSSKMSILPLALEKQENFDCTSLYTEFWIMTQCKIVLISIKIKLHPGCTVMPKQTPEYPATRISLNKNSNYCITRCSKHSGTCNCGRVFWRIGLKSKIPGYLYVLISIS